MAGRAGLQLEPRETWTLYRLAETGECTLEGLSSKLGVPPERIEPGVHSLVRDRLVEEVNPDGDGCTLVLTPSGTDAIERLTEARRASMTDLLEGWNPEEHPEVIELIHRLATSLLADDDKLLAEARAAAG